MRVQLVAAVRLSASNLTVFAKFLEKVTACLVVLSENFSFLEETYRQAVIF